MGRTELRVSVETQRTRDFGLYSVTQASYRDSDNDPLIKNLASYGCSVISDTVTEGHVREFTRRNMEEDRHGRR